MNSTNAEAQMERRFIPGGGLSIHVAPPPRWPIVLRNTRALHGMLTTLSKEGHGENLPTFALAPWSEGVGWGVFFRDEGVARELACRRMPAFLYDRPVAVTFGRMMRFRLPDMEDFDGLKPIGVETITPVVVRNKCQGGRAYEHPTGANVCNTLAQWVPMRIGMPAIDDGSVRALVVADDARPDAVPLGGKLGVVTGWTGRIVVKVNPLALWLFRCAEIIGFGGRTAYGFGRIKVRVP